MKNFKDQLELEFNINGEFAFMTKSKSHIGANPKSRQWAIGFDSRRIVEIKEILEVGLEFINDAIQANEQDK